jgi:hypothetical protein
MIAVADRILIVHDFRLTGEIANDRNYERVSGAIMATIHQSEIPVAVSSPASPSSAQGRMN